MEGAASLNNETGWVASGRGSHRRLVLRLDDERSERGECSLELGVEVSDAVDHLAVLRDGGGAASALSVLVEDGDSGDNISRVVRVLSALLDQLVGWSSISLLSVPPLGLKLV